jgi:hypothetical protein
MAGKSMDMKDLVLSTLSYLEKSADEESNEKLEAMQKPQKEAPTIKELPARRAAQGSTLEELSQETPEAHEPQKEAPKEPMPSIKNDIETLEGNDREELLRFMTTLRERILVLFEGLQSPNNRNIDAKLDLILNFLEYQLSLIDTKIEDMNAREYEAKRYS